ncbi:CHAT domain-containing protein [Winogradskyella luteola]|uniref:CHAT domain-containing protein n=1 Tax=Winogradskyella luteola TaxID=2828330 RepID=A0A9X1JTB2_9FLAO|nr:CHAT domain-containing tetratricopeptide repeat protein [Winogradskyella luteola]MBV7270457.1 CHAT domain-containing protein [Winogradskyella luteola]
MKTIISLLIIASFSALGYTQNAQAAQEKFYKAYDTKNAVGMNQAADEYIKYNSDNSYGYVFKSFAAIAKNDLPTAKKYATIANQMFPMESSNYSLQSYIAYLENRMADAEKMMTFAFQLSWDAAGAKSTKDELDMLASMTGKDFTALKTIADKADAATPGAVENFNAYNACVNKWYEGKPCDVFANLKKWKNFSPVNPMISDFVTATKGIANYTVGKFDDAKPQLETAINSSNLNPYTKAICYEKLSWYDRHELNKTYRYADLGLKEVRKLKANNLVEADLLFRKYECAAALGRSEESLQLAKELLALATTLGNDYHIINANNAIGAHYVLKSVPNAKEIANKHLGAAYALATQRNFVKEKMKAAGNYAIVKFKLGNKQEAIRLNNEVYDHYVKTNQWESAQNAANNIGFMFYMNNDYGNASKQFQKAVDITEQHLPKFSAQEQLYGRNLQSSAYSGLIMSLQKLNQPSRLFDVQDMNRSRILRQKLGQNIKQVSLAETQKMLKEHEVLLYYSKGEPGQMIVNVITNNSAKIIENHPINDWLLIKKQFTNRIQKKPNVINNYVTKLNEEVVNGQIYQYSDPKVAFKAKDFKDFVGLSREVMEVTDDQYLQLQNQILKHWYKWLIKPVESNLLGKKTIIISAEDEFHTMPFEAFIDGNSKYLLENYNIKYIPSATVLSVLEQRAYTDNRKPLLAMGGATYQPKGNVKGNVRNQMAYFKVQENITEKINTNKKNLSAELQALGYGGANYLAGTLREVENLKKIIPDARILVGDEMKETDIKRLNRSGELDDYKYIHIATHGFANSTIPELSGVMMTQPNGGDNPDDMFLLAHEIAALNLKADMAVLSACETALGKNYKGEGINGLNSSLLIAGANSTLLSLWPVDDAGTMILMTETYNNLYQKKMTVEDAVNTAKRTMLNGTYGDRFKTPKIWAPFVLNGK